MADRTLPALLATGLSAFTRTKAEVSPVTSSGPLRELSGMGFGGGIRESFPGAWQRNITVEGVTSLLAFSPIYACVTRIANDIAKLGLVLMEEQAGLGISEPAVKTSPYWTVLRTPNGFQNRIQFVRQWLLSKLLFGNAYGIKFRDARGVVNAVYMLDPRRVTPLVTPDGGVYYGIASDDLARLPMGMMAAPASEVIHDRGATLWHPLVGVAPIYACALSGTLGRRIQQNSAAFFENMSRPSGILTAPGTIEEPTAERLKREWNENFSGSKLGKVAVLGDGLEYQAMTIAAEQSQLVQQLGVSAVDVATAFGMPAYKINQGPMPTNNNVQALNQQYYSDCLQTYIEDFELCLSEGLELKPEYSVECDLDGLLRMDSATQMDVLTKGVAGSTIAIDEARRKLNMRPVTGGSTIWMQQQNYSLDALMKRDRQPDPFHPPAPAPAAAPMPEPAPPAPAPASAQNALEGLLGKALEDTRAAIERAAAAEEARRSADTAQAQAEEEARRSVDAAAAARTEADAAIARAVQAEQRLAEPPAPAPAAVEKLADALLAGFEALEPACG